MGNLSVTTFIASLKAFKHSFHLITSGTCSPTLGPKKAETLVPLYIEFDSRCILKSEI